MLNEQSIWIIKMQYVIYSIILFLFLASTTQIINGANVSADYQMQVGVFEVYEGINTGKIYLTIPVKNGRIFAKDIIEGYCNLRPERLCEDVQIKYKYKDCDIRYSSDLPKLKSCDADKWYYYKFFAAKRYLVSNHKKVELAAFGQLDKDYDEEYETEV